MEAPRDVRLKLEILSKEIAGRDKSHRLLAADVARIEAVAEQAHVRLRIESDSLKQQIGDRDVVIQELIEQVQVLSQRLDKAAEWAKSRNGQGESKNANSEAPA